MAVATYALTTRQKVKDLLGLTDNTKDEVIDMLINSVSDFIEGFCGGRRFMTTAYVEIYDTIRADKIFLNQRPATAVTKVEYRAGVPSAPTWVTFDANSYLAYLKPAYIRFFAKFNPVPMAFQITYNAGYLVDWSHEMDITKHTLPFDLTGVATEMAAKRFNMRLSQGIYSESTEGQSVTYETERYVIQDDHKQTLNKYKLYRVAA